MSNTTDAQKAERKIIADQILALLANSQSTALSILQEHHPEDDESPLLWQENPDLYATITERLIREGHPGTALALALEWQSHLPKSGPPAGDTPSEAVPEGYEVRYTLARAAVRAGNLRYGSELLRPILKIARRLEPTIEKMPPRLRVDIVALAGRILKDQSRQDPTFCVRAAKAYEAAGSVPGADTLLDANTFPLVNAATMWRVAAAAEPEKATEYIEKSKALAQTVIDRALKVVDARVAANDYWLPATIGEASVLLGEHEKAVEWYLMAIEMARAQDLNGEVISMVGNLRRLVEVGATLNPEEIAKHVGNVIVFSGHMVDSPERLAKPGARSRFPNTDVLVHKLEKEIEVKLKALNATTGYCSLACGSDILFAEAMLNRRAELHVVLPFAIPDFLRMSVNFGLSDSKMQRWTDRFKGILARIPPERHHFATTEPYLGTEELFGFVNSFTQGLAVIRGRQQFVTPKALIILEPEAEAAPGGTEHFRQTWEVAGFETEMIDLAKVRMGVPVPPVKTVSCTLPERDEDRPIKALLFADVVNFSRIDEDVFRRFLHQYTAFLQRAFNSKAGQAKLHYNIWGDGMHLVFKSVTEAAEFALSLLELAGMPASAGGVDWEKFGMAGEIPLRIALHTGPVFTVRGLSESQPSYFGKHVNWAARIEPVTVPGCVYASEQFAALLTMESQSKEQQDKFICEFVGIQKLPKKTGRCPLYHITRAIPRHEQSALV